MATNIILLSGILSYSVIVSQSYMYIIALKNVQNNMDATAYIELRKLLDINFMAKYKYAVYAALLTNLLVVITHISSPVTVLFVTALIAFLALMADVLLTLKGNLPVNKIINSWSPVNYPSNW